MYVSQLLSKKGQSNLRVAEKLPLFFPSVVFLGRPDASIVASNARVAAPPVVLLFRLCSFLYSVILLFLLSCNLYAFAQLAGAEIGYGCRVVLRQGSSGPGWLAGPFRRWESADRSEHLFGRGLAGEIKSREKSRRQDLCG